eukprot:m.255952 g.255952  ORF g.255952 m.255952 type:complete len:245 (-) comp19623_c0_seq29:1243-1977(-)
MLSHLLSYRCCLCSAVGWCAKKRHSIFASIFSRKPSVNHVTVVIFLEFFTWGLVATILPEAIENYFGEDRMWLVVGLMQGIKGFLAFLMAPMIGALSDIWGRKMLLVLTVASTCLPLAFLLLENLWWHVFASILSGPFAVTFTIAFAYVSDVTPEGAPRNAAFGQVSATFAASMVISPAVGSFVDSIYGPYAVYAFSVFISVIDVVFILFLVPEVRQLFPRRSWHWFSRVELSAGALRYTAILD